MKPKQRAWLIIVVVWVATAYPSLARCDAASMPVRTVSVAVAPGSEAARLSRLSRGAKVLIIAAGRDEVQCRLMEDAIALHCLELGLQVAERSRVEEVVFTRMREALQKGEDEDATATEEASVANLVGLCETLSVDAVIGVTLSLGQITRVAGKETTMSTSVMAASLRIIDVSAADSPLLVAVANHPEGRTIPEVAQALMQRVGPLLGKTEGGHPD